LDEARSLKTWQFQEVWDFEMYLELFHLSQFILLFVSFLFFPSPPSEIRF